MLVATAGQTASYPLHSGAPKKICHSTSATSKNSNNNLNSHKTARPTTNKLPEPPTNAASAASALMKTLSVRLNRGTEFLKGTVQKALIVSATSSTNSTVITNTSNISSTSSAKIIPSSSFLKQYTVPPTATHRYPNERLQTSSADSGDSLHKEMCHFKPIRLAPLTPRKSGKNHNASLKFPKANLATKVNVNCDDPLAGGNEGDGPDGEPYSYAHFRPKPSSVSLTRIVSSPSHKSAFVCLIAPMPRATPMKSANSRKELSRGRSSSNRRKLPKKQSARKLGGSMKKSLHLLEEPKRIKSVVKNPKYSAKRNTRRVRLHPLSPLSIELLPWLNNNNKRVNESERSIRKRKLTNNSTDEKYGSPGPSYCNERTDSKAASKLAKIRPTSVLDWGAPVTRLRLKQLQQNNAYEAAEYLRRAL